MVYDCGEGDEEEILKEEFLRIDFKKVEIKNIKEISLMSVDVDGNEIDISLLIVKLVDVVLFYLWVIIYDNKIIRLVVDKIEEVEKDGKILYKVIVKVFDLI